MSFLKTVFKLPKFDDDIRDTNFGLKKKENFSVHLPYISTILPSYLPVSLPKAPLLHIFYN